MKQVHQITSDNQREAVYQITSDMNQLLRVISGLDQRGAVHQVTNEVS